MSLSGLAGLALATLLSLASASASAQQLYEYAHCFYRTPVAAQQNLVGCNISIASGRVMWLDGPRNILYDPLTGNWLGGDGTSNIYVWSSRGRWELIQSVVGGPELLAELRRPQHPQQFTGRLSIGSSPPPSTNGMRLIIEGPSGPLPPGGGAGAGEWTRPDCRRLPGMPCPGQDAVYVHPNTSRSPQLPRGGR